MTKFSRLPQWSSPVTQTMSEVRIYNPDLCWRENTTPSCVLLVEINGINVSPTCDLGILKSTLSRTTCSCVPSWTKCSVFPPLKHLILWDNMLYCDAPCKQKGFHPEQHMILYVVKADRSLLREDHPWGEGELHTIIPSQSFLTLTHFALTAWDCVHTLQESLRPT